MSAHELKPKRDDRRAIILHDDLKRLVKSMQALMVRRYPVQEERKLVVGQIMAEVQKVV